MSDTTSCVRACGIPTKRQSCSVLPLHCNLDAPSFGTQYISMHSSFVYLQRG
jgi:hypothetical protein